MCLANPERKQRGSSSFDVSEGESYSLSDSCVPRARSFTYTFSHRAAALWGREYIYRWGSRFGEGVYCFTAGSKWWWHLALNPGLPDSAVSGLRGARLHVPQSLGVLCEKCKRKWCPPGVWAGGGGLLEGQEHREQTLICEISLLYSYLYSLLIIV